MENTYPQITDNETLRRLPIIFQELRAIPLKKQIIEWEEKSKFVKIDFYQTPQYQTDSHYKPLSKIVKNQP